MTCISAGPGIYKVPEEVLEKLFSHCLSPELYRLCLTSKRICKAASRILYRIIPKMSVEKTIQFLISLCFYERNTPYVWSLVIPFSTVSITKRLHTLETLKHLKKLGNPMKFIVFRRILQSPMTLLATALMMLPNLQSLELRLKAADGCDQNVALLLGHTTFRLTKLSTTVEFSTAMGRFLRTQTHLRELHCPTSLTPVILDKNLLPAGSLPQLDTITWSSRLPINVVRYMLNRRPITGIIVLVEMRVPDLKSVLDIGPVSQNIKAVSLMINADDLAAEQLVAVALQFPAVCEVSIKLRKLDENFMAQMTTSVHHFESLDRLVLGAHTVTFQRWEDLIEQHLTVAFEKCPSLTSTIFSIEEKGKRVHYIFRRRPWSGGRWTIDFIQVPGSNFRQ